MFTGIIEEVGILKQIKHGAKSSILTVQAKKVLSDTNIGDSIATNGVCLTVVKMKSDSFEADVMAESLRRTNLGDLKTGDQLNLERALTPNTRLGGHIVSGHIDGTGTIKSFVKEDNAVLVTINASYNILRYIIEKGSIAIDGISLTVANVDNEKFTVSLIPHTGEQTILLKKKAGDTVNLECDLIGKYVERLISMPPKKEDNKQSSLSEKFLQENGFL